MNATAIPKTPLVIALLLAVGVTVAFLISNGSFYLLSSRFTLMSMAEYSARVAKYFLPYAMSTFVYVMIAAAMHAVATLILQSEPVNGKQGL